MRRSGKCSNEECPYNDEWISDDSDMCMGCEIDSKTRWGQGNLEVERGEQIQKDPQAPKN